MRFWELLKKPEIILLILYFFIFFAGILYIKNNTARHYLGAGGCMLYEQTGLFCPACGGTRALEALLRGDLLGALGYNLLILLLPLFLYAGYVITEMVIKKKSVNDLVVSPFIIWFTLIIVILYFILRNIPVLIFDFLRP